MDEWVTCDAGHVHWGAYGAAGLLFCHPALPVEETTYLLTQRARSVDEPGTWTIPGGAIRQGETPEAAAQREATEEIGSLPPYRTLGIDRQLCEGGWCFYFVRVDVEREFKAFCAQETDATGWFRLQDMDRLTLHPGMRTWLARARLSS